MNELRNLFLIAITVCLTSVLFSLAAIIPYVAYAPIQAMRGK